MPEPSLLFALSEIQALATKATRGAGFSWGEAEEAGWAVMWLSREGLPGADLLLAAIESPELCAPTPQPFCWRTPGRLCPLRAGMALMDFAELPSGLANTPLHLEEVAVPGLLLPFVAQAAHQLAQPLLLHAPVSVKGVVAWFHAASLRGSSFFSGLSQTVVGSSQFRVPRVHRWGLWSLAAA
jgi:hypothetical protein